MYSIYLSLRIHYPLSTIHHPLDIVGILNTTPDSYFDGGKYDQVKTAVAHAGKLLEDGADIIDIGGESTGPGSNDVSVEQELERTIKIIEAIKSAYPEGVLAIDTYKAQVARQAIERGVTMVNDITAGRGDSNMFSLIAETGVQYVLMYSKDSTARTTKKDIEYDDVINTIREFLEERIELAKQSGVKQSQMIIDPGMGHFISSIPTYSFEVIEKLDQLSDLGPIYVSPSRKSFLAGPNNDPPSERLQATIEASISCTQNGASYIRTHDVRELVEALA